MSFAFQYTRILLESLSLFHYLGVATVTVAFFLNNWIRIPCRGFSFFSSVVMVSCCCWCQLHWTCRCTVSPWLTELLVVLYCNWKFCDSLGSNVRLVLAMPILSQMPKAINQCSLRICNEPISKWGSNPFVSIFCICKASTVIFTLFLLNITYSFFERRSPLFHLRWHDSLLLNLFAFIFSRKRFFWASTFSPWFRVLN